MRRIEYTDKEMEELYDLHKRTLYSIAYKFYNNNDMIDIDDALAEANIAFVKAIKLYDWDRAEECKLNTFIVLCVTRHLTKVYRELFAIKRTSNISPLSLDTIINSGDVENTTLKDIIADDYILEDDIYYRDTVERIYTMLRKRDLRCKKYSSTELFTEHYIKNKTVGCIARKQSLPLGTVNKRIFDMRSFIMANLAV